VTAVVRRDSMARGDVREATASGSVF